MQQIQLEPPKPEEIESSSEASLDDWFTSPPFHPTGEPWQWLTPEASRDIRRLSGYFHRLFDFGGDWFTASRDRPEYLAAFRANVLAAAPSDCPVYVLHGQYERYEAAFTTVGGFLDCWPRLRLVEDEYRGFKVFPLDVSFWLEVVAGGTAHVAHRAV